MIKFLIPIFCAIFFCALTSEVNAAVWISEVMPNPVTSGDKSEWVELANSEASPVDLSGWLLDDKPLPPGTIISANGYLVLTKSAPDFIAEFGESFVPSGSPIVLATLLQHAISLSNSGDVITLVRNGTTVDQLVYGNAKEGESAQRKGPLCPEVSFSKNFSPGLQNAELDQNCFAAPSPTIDIEFSTDGVSWAPRITAIGPVNLFAKAALPDGISAEQVRFQIDDDREFTSSISLNYLPPTKIKAIVSAGAQTWEQESDIVHVLPKLKISEVMPNPEGTDTDREWVELFNPLSESVALSSCELKDSQGKILAFAGSDVIASRQYAVVSLPGFPLLNCSSSSQCTETISLICSSVELDKVSYQSTISGQSWSWTGDGWSTAWAVTPGAENEDTSVAVSNINNTPQLNTQAQSSEIGSTSGEAESSLATSKTSSVLAASAGVDEAFALKAPSLTPVELEGIILPQAPQYLVAVPLASALWVVTAMLVLIESYCTKLLHAYVKWWLR